MRTEGSTLQAAFKGDNKQTPGKLLADIIEVDERNRLLGTIRA
jgi:hypothetical protein